MSRQSARSLLKYGRDEDDLQSAGSRYGNITTGKQHMKFSCNFFYCVEIFFIAEFNC